MALKKYCNHCGCSRRIDISQTYCAEHSKEKTERNAEYDRLRRDKKAKAFYNSLEWQAARAAVLARDTGIDVYIYMTEKRIIRADMVHHIVELREDYTKRSALDNLISMATATHEGVIRQAYSRPDTKREMQQALREAIAGYQRVVGGGSQKVF